MHILFGILAVVGAVLTGFLYWLGLEESLLWYYPWFDAPLHIAGGLTIGLWAFSLAWRRRYSSFQALVFIMLLALGIGVVWELFEHLAGLTNEKGYWLDTLGDVSADVGGALLAWAAYWLFRLRSETRL